MFYDSISQSGTAFCIFSQNGAANSNRNIEIDMSNYFISVLGKVTVKNQGRIPMFNINLYLTL